MMSQKRVRLPSFPHFSCLCFLEHPPKWQKSSSCQWRFSPLGHASYNHLYEVCYTCYIVSSVEHFAQGLGHFGKTSSVNKQLDGWDLLQITARKLCSHLSERKDSKFNFIKLIPVGILELQDEIEISGFNICPFVFPMGLRVGWCGLNLGPSVSLGKVLISSAPQFPYINRSTCSGVAKWRL